MSILYFSIFNYSLRFARCLFSFLSAYFASRDIGKPNGDLTESVVGNPYYRYESFFHGAKHVRSFVCVYNAHSPTWKFLQLWKRYENAVFHLYRAVIYIYIYIYILLSAYNTSDTAVTRLCENINDSLTQFHAAVNSQSVTLTRKMSYRQTVDVQSRNLGCNAR